MKKMLPALTVLIMSATMSATVSGQEIKPWVGPNEVRYFYEISSKPHTFEVGGKPVMGYAVLKWEKVRGTIEMINGRLFRYTTEDGRKEVYVKGPDSRGFGSVHPLQLYVCDGDKACKGWTFVVPPFRGIRITPPAPVLPDPVIPATPNEAKPVPASPPQVLETRFMPAIYKRGK